MAERPLATAIAALVRNKEVLMIRRAKEPYAGYWVMPGGKIENGETLSEAAIREIREETGLDATFQGMRAVMSENLIENGSLSKHFIIFLCSLAPTSGEVKESNEGELRWWSWEEIEKRKNEFIGSDIELLKHLFHGEGIGHFNSVIEKKGSAYFLKSFEAA